MLRDGLHQVYIMKDKDGEDVDKGPEEVTSQPSNEGDMELPTYAQETHS